MGGNISGLDSEQFRLVPQRPASQVVVGYGCGRPTAPGKPPCDRTGLQPRSRQLAILEAATTCQKSSTSFSSRSYTERGAVGSFRNANVGTDLLFGLRKGASFWLASAQNLGTFHTR
jgi:hypothetical protein